MEPFIVIPNEGETIFKRNLEESAVKPYTVCAECVIETRNQKFETYLVRSTRKRVNLKAINENSYVNFEGISYEQLMNDENVLYLAIPKDCVYIKNNKNLSEVLDRI